VTGQFLGAPTLGHEAAEIAALRPLVLLCFVEGCELPQKLGLLSHSGDGVHALFQPPVDVPEGPPVTLRLQRGGIFAADVVMKASGVRPRPLEVKQHCTHCCAQ